MIYFDGWRTSNTSVSSHLVNREIISKDSITLENLGTTEEEFKKLDFKDQVNKVIDLHKKYNASASKLKVFIGRVMKFEEEFMTSGDDVRLMI